MSRKKRLVQVDANAYWTEQLFRTFAPDWDVLLVKPREIRDHMRRHSKSRFGSFVESLEPGLRILHLPMPPRYTTTFWSIGKALLTRAIIKVDGASPDVLVICFPDYGDLFETLKPRTKLYYNYDDYAAHWPDRADAVVAAEDITIARADVSVFVAKYRVDRLAERLPDYASKLHHLPNGVTRTFMAACKDFNSEPPTIMDIPHPRAGYIGALTYRFDFPFFADAAARLPEVQFILGGSLPQATQGGKAWWAGVQLARALPNVHFIGWVDHGKLGDHLGNFDVLLMPYAQCQFNDNACPTKLWDYLGTGLPIVANYNNPETLMWQDVINVAATPEAFAEEIKRALEEQEREGTAPREKRLSIARVHTWEKLGARLEKLIAQQPNKTKHYDRRTKVEHVGSSGGRSD